MSVGETTESQALKHRKNRRLVAVRCPYLRELQTLLRAHDPKVAGSNPAPASERWRRTRDT